ncbi:MAG: trigger factor [Candidatus Kapabacteria bacterium]|nr:trigger factor [Candidatus Kapabacteria bacterium]
MEYVIKNINACERELTLNATTAEFEKFVDAKFKEVSPKVDMKGFRKGKVPAHLVKKMFGAQIDQEAQTDCGNYFFREVTKEKQISILSAPFFKSIDKKDTGIEFVIAFETVPDFELCDYRTMTVKEPVHRVQEDEIEEQLKNILLANGTFSEASTITGENFKLKVKYSVEDPEHPENNRVQKESFDLLLSDSRLPHDLVEAFKDKKVGDIVDFNPENKELVSRYTIEKIEEIHALETTEENIKKLSENKFDNIADFKQELGFQLQEMWDEKAREIMEEEIIDDLIAKHTFEVPNGYYRDNLVKYTMNFYKQQKVELKEKDVLNDLPMFEKYFGDIVMKLAKWSFISDKISMKEKLEIEESDYDDQITKFADQFPGIAPEQLKTILSSNDEFKATMVRKKLMDLLLDFATTEEVDFDEFVKARNQKKELERIAKYNAIQQELKEEKEKIEEKK